MKIGLGFDIHRTDPDRRLIIGGVEIPSEFGLLGHSDADVLTHAVIDALLGAMGQGDIGDRFPDNEACNKDRSSMNMLAEVVELMRSLRYDVVNLDCNIIAQKPKLGAYKTQIRDVLAAALNVSKDQVNIKAKTHERVGALGRCEAIEAQAIVLIEKEMQQ